MSLVEQDLLTIPELLSSSLVFSSVRVFCVVFYGSLFVTLPFGHGVFCPSIYTV